jgi:hypothetical protein
MELVSYIALKTYKARNTGTFLRFTFLTVYKRRDFFEPKLSDFKWRQFVETSTAFSCHCVFFGVPFLLMFLFSSAPLDLISQRRKDVGGQLSQVEQPQVDETNYP